MSEQPHWERGYRVHGYWIETTQYGRVGLTPPRISPVTYTASFHWPKGGYVDRTFDKLPPAKRWIEEMYKANYEQ